MQSIIRFLQKIFSLISWANRLYDRLSNRTITFLIFLCIIPGLYFSYIFVFEKNIWTLQVNLEAGSWTVSVEQKWIVLWKKNCSKTCSFEKISAGTYGISVESPSYTSIHSDFSLLRGETKILTFSLLKNILVASRELPEAPSSSNTSSGSFVGTWNSWSYFLYESPLKLVERIGNNEQILYSAQESVGYSTKSIGCGYFLLKNTKSGYDIFSLSKKEVFHTPDLPGIVISVGWELPILTIRTKSWALLYNTLSSSWEKSLLYDDALSTSKWNVFGLVRNWSDTKKWLLNIPNTEGNLLFFENTNGRRLISSSISDDSMLCSHGNKRYLLDNDGWIQYITNYE